MQTIEAYYVSRILKLYANQVSHLLHEYRVSHLLHEYSLTFIV